jgi:hypothetical protein
MRIVTGGECSWRCDGLAAAILRRLFNRYGADIVIAHGGRPGVDEAFSQADHGLGIVTGYHMPEWVP